MKQITKKEALKSLGDFLLRRWEYAEDSPKGVYRQTRQVWLNRERDDD